MPRSARHDGLTAHRAGLLLEVVVALSIMVAAMAVVGAQLVGGLRITGMADGRTRASELADRIMALLELDPNTAQRLFEERTAEGDFGEAYPEYLWRAAIEPLIDVPGMGQVTVQILYVNAPEFYGDFDRAGIVRELHLLKANPGRIDLTRDFGVAEEQVDMLAQNVPIPGFDPNNLDPQAIASLDPATLLELLPQLMPLIAQFVGGMGGQQAMPNMQDFSPENVQQMINEGLRRSAGMGGDDGGDVLSDSGPGGTTSGLPGEGGNRPGRRGGGRGGRGGRGARGGAGQDGQPAATLEDLRRMQEEFERSGNPPRGGRGGRGARGDGSGGAGAGMGGMGGGATGGSGGRGGRGNRAGGGGGRGGSGDAPMTIEDLNRLRQELEQNFNQGGGRGGGRGGRGRG